MRTCSWMIAAAAVSWPVCTASSAEQAPRVEIRSPLPGTAVVQSVVEDGSQVKKGDLLVKLDDSKIQAALQRLKVELSRAEAEAVAAKAHLQQAQSRGAEVGLAELALKVAQLRRRCHAARFELELKLLDVKIAFAKKRLDLAKRRHERAAAQRRVAVGPDDMEAVELEIVKAQAELETAATERELRRVMHPLEEAELELAAKQTEVELLKTKHATEEDARTATAAVRAHEQTRQMIEAELKQVADLLKQCTIHAPQDGKIQYPRGRGLRSGAAVRQRQPLLILTPVDAESGDQG